MKTQEKWGIFLQTVTKNTSINVEQVTDDEVVFTAGTDSDLRALTTVFSSKELIRENVIVALKQGADQSESPQPPLEPRSPLLDLSGQEIIAKLFTKDFFESIEFNPETLLDNPLYRTATLVVSEASPIRLKRALTTYELMQSALSNPELVASILNGNTTKAIAQEPKTGEITGFGKSVVNIMNTSVTSANVVFNYGFLQAFMQNQHGLGMGDSPIIAASTTQVGRFTLKKDALLRFVHNALSSNLIFREEDDGELRPVVFKERQTENQNPASLNLHMLLDVSGSMEENFKKYQEKIKETLKKITSASKEWEITLTSFNAESHSVTFSTENQNDLDDLYDFVDNLKASGKTNLNGAIFDTISNIDQDQSATLLVFTDGLDTEHSHTEESVATATLDMRKQNDQFMMFSLGFGKEYNKPFFDNLSKLGGFLHTHLDNIAQFSEFNQYIGSLNVKKVVFEFVTEAAKNFFMQCPEGEVAVSSSTVPVNAQVRHAGQQYEAIYRTGGTIRVQGQSSREI